jgi:hypothetical protein
MLIGAILYRDNKEFFDKNPKVLQAVTNIFLDVGIRRIIAGLHYPYDHEGAKLFVEEVVKEWNIPKYVQLLARRASVY